MKTLRRLWRRLTRARRYRDAWLRQVARVDAQLAGQDTAWHVQAWTRWTLETARLKRHAERLRTVGERWGLA